MKNSQSNCVLELCVNEAQNKMDTFFYGFIFSNIIIVYQQGNKRKAFNVKDEKQILEELLIL